MTILRLLALMLFAILAATLTHVAHADALNVSWTHPTEYTNGSPLPVEELRETLVAYGLCDSGKVPAGAPTVAVAAPAASTVIAGVGVGEWCVHAVAVSLAGVESDPSNVASKVISPPPPPPTPGQPTNVTIDIQVTGTITTDANGAKIIVR